MQNPTQLTYGELTEAYDFFNARLFAGGLPPCLITMQRKSKAFGYFAGERFSTRAGEAVTDEIALNPSHFRARTTEQSLSTLVHEMVHLWQHHHGKPSKGGYHNKQWAAKMRAVGLIPTDTGAAGGKETGQSVTHMIEPGGAFDLACAELVRDGFEIPYIELWNESQAGRRKAKTASKTKYTCPGCGTNAWAKPGTALICGDCQQALESEEPGDEAEAA